MVDFVLVAWKGMKSYLAKLSYPINHCKETLGDLFCNVNVIGLWTRYDTSSCDHLYDLLYEKKV